MYRKIHKSQEYLFFPRMLAEYLPHLCSSVDTILSSVSYMQISPVCTRERVGLCKDSSGCCFAAQAAELSVVNPALLDGSCGLCPAGQLSAQPGRDGAGSKPGDTDSAWWGVPTRHLLLGYCNRKNRQKNPKTLEKTKPPQPNTQSPKTLNKHKFHYPCSGHAASKQLPK